MADDNYWEKKAAAWAAQRSSNAREPQQSHPMAPGVVGGGGQLQTGMERDPLSGLALRGPLLPSGPAGFPTPLFHGLPLLGSSPFGAAGHMRPPGLSAGCPGGFPMGFPPPGSPSPFGGMSMNIPGGFSPGAGGGGFVREPQGELDGIGIPKSAATGGSGGMMMMSSAAFAGKANALMSPSSPAGLSASVGLQQQSLHHHARTSGLATFSTTPSHSCPASGMFSASLPNALNSNSSDLLDATNSKSDSDPSKTTSAISHSPLPSQQQQQSISSSNMGLGPQLLPSPNAPPGRPANLLYHPPQQQPSGFGPPLIPRSASLVGAPPTPPPSMFPGGRPALLCTPPPPRPPPPPPPGMLSSPGGSPCNTSGNASVLRSPVGNVSGLSPGHLGSSPSIIHEGGSPNILSPLGVPTATPTGGSSTSAGPEGAVAGTPSSHIMDASRLTVAGNANPLDVSSATSSGVALSASEAVNMNGILGSGEVHNMNSLLGSAGGSMIPGMHMPPPPPGMVSGVQGGVVPPPLRGPPMTVPGNLSMINMLDPSGGGFLFHGLPLMGLEASQQKALPQWLRDAVKEAEKKENAKGTTEEADDEREDGKGDLLTPSSVDEERGPKEIGELGGSEANGREDDGKGSSSFSSSIPLEDQIKKTVTNLLLSITDDFFGEVSREALAEARRKFVASQQVKPAMQSAFVFKLQKPSPLASNTVNTTTSAAVASLSPAAAPTSAAAKDGGTGLGEDNTVMATNALGSALKGYMDVDEDVSNSLAFLPSDTAVFTEGLLQQNATSSAVSRTGGGKGKRKIGEELLLSSHATASNIVNPKEVILVTCKPPETASVPPSDVFELHVFENGKELASTYLNSSHMVFGSSSKSAHIIDEHPSVYSQHCAISHISKNIYVSPFGGHTRLVSNASVPFLSDLLTEKKEEAEIIEIQSNELRTDTESVVKARGDETGGDETGGDETGGDETEDATGDGEIKEEKRKQEEEVDDVENSEKDGVSRFLPPPDEGVVLFPGDKRFLLTEEKSCFMLGDSQRVYFMNLQNIHQRLREGEKKQQLLQKAAAAADVSLKSRHSGVSTTTDVSSGEVVVPNTHSGRSDDLIHSERHYHRGDRHRERSHRAMGSSREGRGEEKGRRHRSSSSSSSSSSSVSSRGSLERRSRSRHRGYRGRDHHRSSPERRPMEECSRISDRRRRDRSPHGPRERKRNVSNEGKDYAHRSTVDGCNKRPRSPAEGYEDERERLHRGRRERSSRERRERRSSDSAGSRSPVSGRQNHYLKDERRRSTNDRDGRDHQSPKPSSHRERPSKDRSRSYDDGPEGKSRRRASGEDHHHRPSRSKRDDRDRSSHRDSVRHEGAGSQAASSRQRSEREGEKIRRRASEVEEGEIRIDTESPEVLPANAVAVVVRERRSASSKSNDGSRRRSSSRGRRKKEKKGKKTSRKEKKKRQQHSSEKSGDLISDDERRRKKRTNRTEDED